MVHKVCKRGVRSGNTLRASNSRFLRQYRLHSCIRRELVNNEGKTVEFSDTLGENANHDKNIVFSLNKKGRWALPTQLRSDILYGHVEDEDYSVQLTEKHRLLKNANCISFASTSGNVRQTSIKKNNGKRMRRGRKRSYFQVASILNAKPAFTGKRRRKNRSKQVLPVTNSETGEHLSEHYSPPKIRYEVFYPTPMTSSITYNPKYIDPNFRDNNSSNRRNKLRKTRTKLIDVIQEDWDNFDSDFDDFEEEEIISCPETSDNDYDATIEEILFHAKKAQMLVMRSGKQRQTRIINKHDTEIYENSSGESETHSEQQFPYSSTFDPVTIIIACEETDEWVLKQKFGDKILECYSFPRKFVLDISERVSELDNLRYVGKSKADITFACLVFEHDVDNEINNRVESVFKVSLNMPLTDETYHVKIETIFDYMLMTVDEVIEKSVFFVGTLPEEIILKKKGRCVMSSFASNTALEECANWESESYQLNTKILLDKCFHNKGQRDGEESLDFETVSHMDVFSPEPVDISTPADKFCSVCFESIGGGVSATALMSCAHWFCNACWKKHLITKIGEGRIDLKCPEYDCKKKVDIGTLISLLDINYLERYLRHLHDLEVEQKAGTKWCPNPKCGAVLRVPSDRVKAVSCQCGRKVCFDCLCQSHWPASCAAAAGYRQKLVENGDDNLLPSEKISAIVIRGKSCPSCNRFVQKDGGCPYVYCPCGIPFCWGCGKTWDSVIHGTSCYTYGYKNTNETTGKRIQPEDYISAKINASKMGKWYKTALNHRVHQHQAKLRNLKAPIKGLVFELTRYINSMEKRNEPVCLDFDTAGKRYSCEADKIRDFLQNMADLYAELHRIAEHVPIYLETHQRDSEVVFAIEKITNRMTALSESIYDILQNGAANYQTMISNLKEIRVHARNCISGLLKCFETETDG